MEHSDRSWFWVCTRPGGEPLAERALSSVFPIESVYFPKALIERRTRQAVVRPFFHRCGFVENVSRSIGAGIDFWWVSRAPGVARVMTTDYSLARIGQFIIDDLRSREVNGVIPIESVSKSAWSFRPGDVVRIFDGQFRGYNGVFQRWRGRYVEIKLEVFRRVATVVLLPDCMQKLM